VKNPATLLPRFIVHFTRTQSTVNKRVVLWLARGNEKATTLENLIGLYAESKILKGITVHYFSAASDVLEWLSNDANPKQFHIVVPHKTHREGDSLEILRDVLKEKRKYNWWIDTKIAITIFCDREMMDFVREKNFGAEVVVTSSPKKVLQRIVL